MKRFLIVLVALLASCFPHQKESIQLNEMFGHKERAQDIRMNRVSLGMYRTDVEASRGYATSKSISAGGNEVWYYAIGNIAYVTFSNGKVSNYTIRY